MEISQARKYSRSPFKADVPPTAQRSDYGLHPSLPKLAAVPCQVPGLAWHTGWAQSSADKQCGVELNLQGNPISFQRLHFEKALYAETCYQIWCISRSHRTVWVERDLKAHLAPFCKQRHLSVDQAGQGPIQPSLEHLQGASTSSLGNKVQCLKWRPEVMIFSD